MREQIYQRFAGNIARVRNLLAMYTGLGGVGQGRRPLHASDVLRGATVLLHASLEEVLRSAAAWRFPALGENVLNDIALVGTSGSGRPEKFLLGKLVAHREKSVQALLEESVRAHLNYFNVNSTTELASFMSKLGVDPQPFGELFPTLDELISRRHHIVHQADRNEQPGKGQQRARSLSLAQVEAWIGVSEQFVDAFLMQIPE